MNRQDRAKQFAPFEALKGLRDALAQKEYEAERTYRRELSEEEAEEVQRALLNLKKGDNVQITCFDSGHYIVVEGRVNSINPAFKYLIVGEGRIMFEDIYRINRCEKSGF